MPRYDEQTIPSLRLLPPHADFLQHLSQLATLQQSVEVVCAANRATADDDVRPGRVVCSAREERFEGDDVGCVGSGRSDKTGE